MPDISDVTATGWVKDHILTKEIIKLAETRHPDVSYADMKHVLEEVK